MRRALVLNDGWAWAAYQAGALQHVIGERAVHFDLFAGAGMGAINAAFAACGELSSLQAFWDGIALKKLFRLNLPTRWQTGPASVAPLSALLSSSISDARLAERRAKLHVSVFNLQTGREHVLEYPGTDLPLIEALTAAVTIPGLCTPVRYGRQQLVQATLINSFPLHHVLQQPVEDVVAIAAAMRRRTIPRRHYATWRAAADRALSMNQAHDVWDALTDAARLCAAGVAYQQVGQQIAARLAERVADADLRVRLRHGVEDLYRRGAQISEHTTVRGIRAITPSQDFGYPFWRFDRRRMTGARALGYADARATLAGEAAVELPS